MTPAEQTQIEDIIFYSLTHNWNEWVISEGCSKWVGVADQWLECRWILSRGCLSVGFVYHRPCGVVEWIEFNRSFIDFDGARLMCPVWQGIGNALIWMIIYRMEKQQQKNEQANDWQALKEIRNLI